MSGQRIFLSFAVLLGSLLTSQCGSTRGPEERLYQVGVPIEIGPLVYNVLDVDWRDQLGEGPGARLPQHRFLAVNLRITNSGAREAAIPMMTLVDARGNTTEELTDGQGLDKWLGIPRTVKPTQTEYGRVLFDVIPGDYKMRLSDDSEQDKPRTALVAVPFQFHSTAPALPVPQQ